MRIVGNWPALHVDNGKCLPRVLFVWEDADEPRLAAAFVEGRKALAVSGRGVARHKSHMKSSSLIFPDYFLRRERATIEILVG